jgi:hypothetical protein
MHFYGFEQGDPIFEIPGWEGFYLSFQIITLENIYGLSPQHLEIASDHTNWTLNGSMLTWGGGQQQSPGRFTAKAHIESTNRLRLDVHAQAGERITAVKILVRKLPPVQPLDLLDGARNIPDGGLLDKYPNQLRLPLWLAALPDGKYLGFRCEDRDFRAKRFTAYRENMGRLAGTYTIECIHEQDARLFDTTITVPTWIFDRDAEPETFRAEQLTFNERETGLPTWESRTDVPAWTRDIKLALTLHGMHWSGFTFNDYAQMLDTIRFVAERIDGKHVLAYLPGWEGRYYWQYGDFRPEPLLGGEEGFAKLCAEAKKLGVHIMPMFGGNCANSWSPNFHTFGPSSYMKTATRNVFHGNQPDWNTSRTQDTGWQAWLNPGAPAWQTELTRQIITLIDRYDFDAVFLDTVEVWVNDPDFNIREGYRQLVDRLRTGRPDLLITGEDWWDALLGIFPIFQQTSKWRQVPDWVGRYARLIGHICDGEASRGSTGVFESGYAPYERLPDKNFYIPTLAFVDGTLENARDEIEAVIALAKQRP